MAAEPRVAALKFRASRRLNMLAGDDTGCDADADFVAVTRIIDGGRHRLNRWRALLAARQAGPGVSPGAGEAKRARAPHAGAREPQLRRAEWP